MVEKEEVMLAPWRNWRYAGGLNPLPFGGESSSLSGARSSNTGDHDDYPSQ